MGKEFNVSEVNKSDIKSVNTMNMKKEQAVSTRKALLAREREEKSARKRAAASEKADSYSGRKKVVSVQSTLYNYHTSVASNQEASDEYKKRIYELELNRLISKRDSYCNIRRGCGEREKVSYDKVDKSIKLLRRDPEQYFYNHPRRKARRNNQAAATSAGSQGNITGEWDSQGRHYTPAGGENAWRDDGVFMQKAAGGYINTQTGEFVPAN
jgi:hypothetical protein